ncbi:MAG: hypothetical protein HY788_08620 [Deltaproteobacteria bacterium]|nr:hypothetical protein [Deltaproteobacteria bacterium]
MRNDLLGGVGIYESAHIVLKVTFRPPESSGVGFPKMTRMDMLALLIEIAKSSTRFYPPYTNRQAVILTVSWMGLIDSKCLFFMVATKNFGNYSPSYGCSELESILVGHLFSFRSGGLAKSRQENKLFHIVSSDG